VHSVPTYVVQGTRPLGTHAFPLAPPSPSSTSLALFWLETDIGISDRTTRHSCPVPANDSGPLPTSPPQFQSLYLFPSQHNRRSSCSLLRDRNGGRADENNENLYGQENPALGPRFEARTFYPAQAWRAAASVNARTRNASTLGIKPAPSL
jgi:hypothetical protein